jgi:hypothetical protein
MPGGKSGFGGQPMGQPTFPSAPGKPQSVQPMPGGGQFGGQFGGQYGSQNPMLALMSRQRGAGGFGMQPGSNAMGGMATPGAAIDGGVGSPVAGGVGGALGSGKPGRGMPMGQPQQVGKGVGYGGQPMPSMGKAGMGAPQPMGQPLGKFAQMGQPMPGAGKSPYGQPQPGRPMWGAGYDPTAF